MKKLTITALALCISVSLFAQEKVDLVTVQKIRQEGLDHSKVMDIAFQITDVAGPRLSNSPGLKRAQDWAVRQFTSWGLKNVHLEAWGQFGKGWQIDKYYAATTLPYYHAIIGAPKAWTPGTRGAIKSEVILIKADTVTDLLPYKGKLAGKIVMFDQVTLQPLQNSYKPDAVRHTDSVLAKMAEAKVQPEGQRRAGAASNMMAQMMKMREVRAAMASFMQQETQ